VLVETLIAAAGALLVLLFVYASFLALLPLLIAAVSILTTFMLVLGLTTFTDVSIIVMFLVALIGLGVAIDYSLILCPGGGRNAPTAAATRKRSSSR
jgi:RND superfamily putative drug exporter